MQDFHCEVLEYFTRKRAHTRAHTHTVSYKCSLAIFRSKQVTTYQVCWWNSCLNPTVGVSHKSNRKAAYVTTDFLILLEN